MINHSYSGMPACFDDPVFASTHFLARVASEDLGVAQLQQRHKLSSAKLDDLQGWDSRWFHRIQSDDDDNYDLSSDDDDRTEARTPVSSPVVKHSRARSSTAPLLAEAPSRLGQTPSAKVRTAPLSLAITTKRSNVRHDRSASAPEPRLMPAQPLSINTAQPLRLAQPDLCTLSPLAYPVGIFDASTAGPSNLRDVVTTTTNPSTRREPSILCLAASSSSSASPSTVSLSSSSPLASADRRVSPDVVARPTVIECSESDGSCHNDAGDADPEGQLAAEIIRLRNARKRSYTREASASTSSAAYPLQPKHDAELKISTSDYSPETDSDDSDHDRSAEIRSYAGHPILRLAEAMLEFGTSSLELLTADRDDDEASDAAGSGSTSPSLRRKQPARRVSTTPKDLCREARLIRLKRQEMLSARSSRSNSVNSLSTWFSSSEPSLSLRARAGRQAMSLLNLPSLLSPSASDGSIDTTTTTASSSTPASLRLSLARLAVDGVDSIEEEDVVSGGGFPGLSGSSSTSYPSFSYGVDDYSDAPAPYLAPSSAGLDVVFQRFDDYSKGGSDLTKLSVASKTAGSISPLWREDIDISQEQQGPNLWTNLFGP